MTFTYAQLLQYVFNADCERAYMQILESMCDTIPFVDSNKTYQ